MPMPMLDITEGEIPLGRDCYSNQILPCNVYLLSLTTLPLTFTDTFFLFTISKRNYQFWFTVKKV